MSNNTYAWIAFDLDSALSGTPVGIDDGEDIEQSVIPVVSGILKERGGGPSYWVTEYDDDDNEVGRHYETCRYCVTINGHIVWCKPDGDIVACLPDDGFIGEVTQLSMLSADIPTTYGTGQTITRSVDPGYSRQISIAALEPRDQFAMQAFRAILATISHPESASDAMIQLVCTACYRWANGMMLAAADARDALAEDGGGGGGDETDTVDVNPDSFTSNTEKILYNIFAALDNRRIEEQDRYDDIQENGLNVVVTEMPEQEEQQEEEPQQNNPS